MGLIAYILLCALVGVIVWAVVTYVPMPQPIKTLIVVVAVVVLILVLLRALGLFDAADVSIPRVD